MIDEDDYEDELREMPIGLEDHLQELDAMELLFRDPSRRRFLNMTDDEVACPKE